MTTQDLERALRAMASRRLFRPFLIELHSGDRILVSHPEAVTPSGHLFVHRGPDRRHRILAGSGVCQLIDPPAAAPGG